MYQPHSDFRLPLELHQRSPSLTHLPHAVHNPAHLAINGTSDDSLHLHALNHNQRLVLHDLVSSLDFNSQDFARHRSADAVRRVFGSECFGVPGRLGERQVVLQAVLEEGEVWGGWVTDQGCGGAGVRVEGGEGAGC